MTDRLNNKLTSTDVAAAYMMVRIATKDSTLSIPRRDEPAIVEQVVVRKDAALVLDTIGMCKYPLIPILLPADFHIFLLLQSMIPKFFQSRSHSCRNAG